VEKWNTRRKTFGIALFPLLIDLEKETCLLQKEADVED